MMLFGASGVCHPPTGGRTASGFPDGEVFATGHDRSDFVLTIPVAMPMVLKRILKNEIPEQLQIIRRDVSLLAGEIQGFVQPAIMLRQKSLAF
jgi:hypothetical protein